MFSLALAKEKGTIDDQTYNDVVKELSLIPEKMKEVLEQNEKIAVL